MSGPSAPSSWTYGPADGEQHLLDALVVDAFAVERLDAERRAGSRSTAAVEVRDGDPDVVDLREHHARRAAPTLRERRLEPLDQLLRALHVVGGERQGPGDGGDGLGAQVVLGLGAVRRVTGCKA